MVKRKHLENQPALEQSSETATAIRNTEATNGEHPAEDRSQLVEEVQSFLEKRNELARRLDQEIEATETKLSELKRTKAQLFPESTTPAQPERPARKPKKTSAKSPRANSDSSTMEPQKPAEENKSDSSDAATTDAGSTAQAG